MATSFKAVCIMLAVYVVLGLALGLADPWLGQVAQTLGVKPGVATAVSVNLLLTLAAAILGFCHAWVALACAGAVIMTGGFIAGLAVQYFRFGQDWSAAALLHSVSPILVAAAVGYAVIGAIAARAGHARAQLQNRRAVTPG